jgi:hypothetical protein
VTAAGVRAPTDEARAVLDEVLGMFRAAFAWGAWGRLLVSLSPNDAGSLVVDDVLVEEIVGDEGALDRAFGRDDARACLPALAAAVVALAMADGIDADRVTGGTFIMTHDGGVAFLPGLVRAPSPSLDARREELVAGMRAKNAVLGERYGIGAGAEIGADMKDGTVEVSRAGAPVAVGRQVVIGSFAARDRAWVWGAHNPSLVPEARARCAALLDGLADRSMWEIATPGFTTDEPTTWLYAALLTMEHDLEGVARVSAGSDGFVLLGLSDLSPAAVA